MTRHDSLRCHAGDRFIEKLKQFNYPQVVIPPELGETIALISDPLGFEVQQSLSRCHWQNNPASRQPWRCNLHIAKVKEIMKAEENMGMVATEADADPLFDVDIMT